MRLFLFAFVLNLGRADEKQKDSEKDFPTLCHVCKYTVTEFLSELHRSTKSQDVLQLGQVLQTGKPKKIVYNKSGLRLIEALEETCQNMKDYKVHKDKPNHSRYAKDESLTFTTLKNLKKRGIKVDLGFPDEMWDTPDAEIVKLKSQCEHILELHEDHLNDWYFHHQEENLFDWFCKEYVLKGHAHDCLEGATSFDNDDNDDDDGDDDGKKGATKNKIESEKKCNDNRGKGNNKKGNKGKKKSKRKKKKKKDKKCNSANGETEDDSYNGKNETRISERRMTEKKDPAKKKERRDEKERQKKEKVLIIHKQNQSQMELKRGQERLEL